MSQVTIDNLVEMGEVGEEAAFWLKQTTRMQTADELYGHVRMAINHGTPELKQKYADNLGVPVDKLGDFAEYLKPHLYNPANDSQSSDGDYRANGYRIPEEILARTRRVQQAMDDPDEYDNLQRQQQLLWCIKDQFRVGQVLEIMARDSAAREWILSTPSATRFEPADVHESTKGMQDILRVQYEQRYS